MALRIQELKLSLQLEYLLLMLFVLILLGNGKKILDFSPTPTSQPSASSFFYLLPCLKLLALRYKLLDLFAVLRTELTLIEELIEEAFDDLNACVDEGFVLAEGDFGLHEGEDAVFWEGWEDVAWLFFGEDLSGGGFTSKMSAN